MLNRIGRENLLRKMVKDNEIGKKDIPVYRFLIGLFRYGADYDKVVEWTGTPKKDAKEWWTNLEKAEYIKGKSKKIYLDKGFWKTNDICFLLMGACAQGYISRRLEK
jgi:hypothetical protein